MIDDLVQSIERLQEAKADRENVASEMDIKADKHALDGKVNQSMFDETFEMFDRGKRMVFPMGVMKNTHVEIKNGWCTAEMCTFHSLTKGLSLEVLDFVVHISAVHQPSTDR